VLIEKLKYRFISNKTMTGLKGQKIELKDDSVIINNLIVDDLNTYKILNDIPEDKREDFVKKAIVIGAIGLRNLYLT